MRLSAHRDPRMNIATPRRPFRSRLFAIMESGAGSAGSHIFDGIMVAMILANVAIFVLDSVPALDARYHQLFRVVETATLLAFTVEYVARMWICTEHAPLKPYGPLKARLLFALRPSMLIDLLAVLPFWLSAFLPMDLMVLRVLRLVRFLKLGRFSPALTLVGRVIYAERRALMATLVIVLGLLLVSATVIHLAEHQAQPEKFGTIPEGLWWAVTTMTTVGYGDAVPVTPLGRFIAGIVMLLGLGMLALPVSILATGFAAEAHRREFVVTWGMVAHVPLFAELDARAIGEIVALLRAEIVPADMVVARRGEPANAMYFVASGEILLLDAQPEPIILRSGDFFGEVALLGERQRRTTAITRAQCHLLVIEANDFRALLRRRPELAHRIKEHARHAILGDWGHTGAEPDSI